MVTRSSVQADRVVEVLPLHPGGLLQVLHSNWDVLNAHPSNPGISPMATFTLKGSTLNTVGDLPAVGTQAPAFTLIKTDLSPISTADVAGKRVVLNIFPSVDTPTCATSVRRFNAEASKLANTVVLCVSKDLPFAHARFCGAEGLKDVHPVSDFRSPSFGHDFGVTIADGKLQGLLARAVVVLDGAGKVLYTELVAELSSEPDYAKAIAALG
jgi:thiol peroxidase